VQDYQVTVLGNFTALILVNNTPVVTLAGHVHATSSWPRDSLPVSLDNINYGLFVSKNKITELNIAGAYLIIFV